MKLRSTISSVYTTLTLIVGGALSGLVLGYLFYTFFLPPWKVTPISSPHAVLTEILYFDHSPSNNPTNGTLIAKEESGAIFQYNNSWETLDDRGESYWDAETSKCSNWRIRLPMRKIIDSAGIIFKHALASSTKCYALFNNGDMEIWSRTQDFFNLMITLGISTAIGIVTSTIIIFKNIPKQKT